MRPEWAPGNVPHSGKKSSLNDRSAELLGSSHGRCAANGRAEGRRGCNGERTSGEHRHHSICVHRCNGGCTALPIDVIRDFGKCAAAVERSPGMYVESANGNAVGYDAGKGE